MSAPEPITEETHAAALAEIERLIRLDPPAGTPDAVALKELAQRVEAYEVARWGHCFEITAEDIALARQWDNEE